MQRIFDDERRETGPIWPNPAGMRPICLLDVVAKGLKWATLRRLSRLASSQRGHANAATITVHRPYASIATKSNAPPPWISRNCT